MVVSNENADDGLTPILTEQSPASAARLQTRSPVTVEGQSGCSYCLLVEPIVKPLSAHATLLMNLGRA